MKFDVFASQIKQSVSCRQLLETNGINVDRHGFAVCPLHGDNDASLKVYGGDRGWVCYGCHKGGDVINLARELYGLRFNDAIRRLNEEFNVGLDLDGKMSEKDSFAWKAKQIREKYAKLAKEKESKDLEAKYLDWLELYRMLDRLVVDNEPDRDEGWSPFFCGYLRMRAIAKERLKEIYWEWVAYGRRNAEL